MLIINDVREDETEINQYHNIKTLNVGGNVEGICFLKVCNLSFRYKDIYIF